MLLDKLVIQEHYNIKLEDSALIRLEDGIKNKKPLLVTVRASSFSYLNGNSVIYRHDTVKNNIGTFIFPDSKPIITNHKPKESKKFGRVIAVDYKETEFYNKLNDSNNLEGMTSLEYMNFCKNTLIPYQLKHQDFSGLGYCEIVGKIDDQEGIKKVLNKEFLKVSIGADPKKLICSDCLQDQVIKICDHYPKKGNGIFMLAEQLEYEELSFLTGKKPADPRGSITKIHDNKIISEDIYELEDNWLSMPIDIIDAEEFFQTKLNDSTKTIICVDNICKIVNNQEETMAKKQDDQNVINISYIDEFGKDKLVDLKITDSEVDIEETFKLEDEMKDSEFAIIQKFEDEIKRRFPIKSELDIKTANKLIDEAKDITEAELKKAKASIAKAAKKSGIELEIKDSNENVGANVEGNSIEEPKFEDMLLTIKDHIEKLEDFSNACADGTKKQSPVSMILNMLQSLGSTLKWAGEDLKGYIDGYLKDLGKEVVEKGMHDSLTEEVKTLKDELEESKEEITLLDELNRDLNLQVRKSVINDIIACKQELDLLKDSIEDEEKKLVKVPYDALVLQSNDYKAMKAKLRDTSLNNITNVKKVEDPTLPLQDSDNSTNNQQSNDNDKQLTEKELKQFMTNLFSSNIRF